VRRRRIFGEVAGARAGELRAVLRPPVEITLGSFIVAGFSSSGVSLTKPLVASTSAIVRPAMSGPEMRSVAVARRALALAFSSTKILPVSSSDGGVKSSRVTT
jgi:hypothetical protein